MNHSNSKAKRANSRFMLSLAACLMSAIVFLVAFLISPAESSLVTLLSGVATAVMCGAIAGAVIAIFLSRETKAKSSEVSVVDTSSAIFARLRHPDAADLKPFKPADDDLSPDDLIDALPDITRDHSRSAGIYGVHTIREFAQSTPETQIKLRRVLLNALFERSYEIAVDCVKHEMDAAE